jgi:hypothetical protein
MTRAKLNDLTAPAEDARSFDKWFFAQPKKVQDKMRESGVLPYREMVPSKHIFEINPDHKAWATNDPDAIRVEVDSFISRDHVGIMLKAFIDALACSDSFRFRKHVELIRWALSLPGCLSSRMIGRMYGKSHEAMRKRARVIQLSVNSDACGLFPHCNSKRDKMRVSFNRHKNHLADR